MYYVTINSNIPGREPKIKNQTQQYNLYLNLQWPSYFQKPIYLSIIILRIPDTRFITCSISCSVSRSTSRSTFLSTSHSVPRSISRSKSRSKSRSIFRSVSRPSPLVTCYSYNCRTFLHWCRVVFSVASILVAFCLAFPVASFFKAYDIWLLSRVVFK